MERIVTIGDVRTFETRGGNLRYVARDTDGNEYTTFREGIGQAARAFEGRRVEEVPPDELYDKLKPFRERVVRDIEEDAS